MIIPVSGVIATCDRSQILLRTMVSLANQSHLPSELIIVDASADDVSEKKVNDIFSGSDLKVIYVKATKAGAAHQRMQGVRLANEPFIWFFDDDIIFEDECVTKLWQGINLSENVGAVNAMITNQQYTKPGRVTRLMYRLMYGSDLPSYAGKIIGPAWNLLPEDKVRLPEYCECEWLNTTCTFYRRTTMPDPVFSDFFYGYSMFEDATLSITIGRKYKLLNARTARIFHDSQPGKHKDNTILMSQMALVNRYYVMTRVLHRRSLSYNMKLIALEMFGMITSLRTSRGLMNLPKVIWGKILGCAVILKMNDN